MAELDRPIYESLYHWPNSLGADLWLSGGGEGGAPLGSEDAPPLATASFSLSPAFSSFSPSPQGTALTVPVSQAPSSLLFHPSGGELGWGGAGDPKQRMGAGGVNMGGGDLRGRSGVTVE